MPHLYCHKRHGWEIKYNIYYLDGSRRVSKFAKKKTKALDIFSDAEKLETLSRSQSIHKDGEAAGSGLAFCCFSRNQLAFHA